MRVAALTLTASAAIFLLTACTSQPSHRTERSTSNVTSGTSIQTSPPRAAVTPTVASPLDCAAAIDTHAHALPDQTVLGVVDLPISPAAPALQTGFTGNGSGALRLFAKTGLVIRPGARFELIVPAQFTNWLSIGWGNPAAPSHRVAVTGCANETGDWLAYAGGYWTNHPTCVPITVRTATRQQTVYIGLGTACPGQQPPQGPSDR